MDEKDIDLGQLKSRQIGNLISKQLVELGKDAVNSASPNGYVDYGNLPSRALPELGKQVVASEVAKDAVTKY